MPTLTDMPGLGVVFNVEAIEEENSRRAAIRHENLDPQKRIEGLFYGHAAWRIFMKMVQPGMIAPSTLLEGDTQLTLQSLQNEFCIALYGPRLDLEALRQRFLDASDYGLAPFHRRLIEKIALDYQPLVICGRIDPFGRLVTEDWLRREHERCVEAGWPYAPEHVPAELPANRRAELAVADPIQPKHSA